VYEKAGQRHRDSAFGKLDTETEQALAATARISSLPTLMAFRDCSLVLSQPGELPAAALEQVIEGVRTLDMDEVRAQLDAASAQQPAHHAG
jgi:thioredoxin 1